MQRPSWVFMLVVLLLARGALAAPASARWARGRGARQTVDAPSRRIAIVLPSGTLEAVDCARLASYLETYFADLPHSVLQIDALPSDPWEMRRAIEDLAQGAGADVAAWMMWHKEPRQLVISTLMLGDPSGLELSIVVSYQAGQQDELYRTAALKLRAVLRTLLGLPQELETAVPAPAPATATVAAGAPPAVAETTANGRLALSLSSAVAGTLSDAQAQAVFGASVAWAWPRWSHGFSAWYALPTTYTTAAASASTSSLRFLLSVRRQLAGADAPAGFGLWGSFELGAVWDLARATAPGGSEGGLESAVAPAAAVALAGGYRWGRQVGVSLGLRLDGRATRTRFVAHGQEVFTPPWLLPGAFVELEMRR